MNINIRWIKLYNFYLNKSRRQMIILNQKLCMWTSWNINQEVQKQNYSNLVKKCRKTTTKAKTTVKIIGNLTKALSLVVNLNMVILNVRFVWELGI